MFQFSTTKNCIGYIYSLKFKIKLFKYKNKKNSNQIITIGSVMSLFCAMKELCFKVNSNESDKNGRLSEL